MKPEDIVGGSSSGSHAIDVQKDDFVELQALGAMHGRDADMIRVMFVWP